MPRETVESSDVLHGDETPFGLQVGWNRDAGYVQVASVTHRQRSIWWQILASANDSDTENQKLAEVGRLAQDVVANTDQIGRAHV